MTTTGLPQNRPQFVPAGYRLVPETPTFEMLVELGFGGDLELAAGHAAITDELVTAYRKMLDLAPMPSGFRLGEDQHPEDMAALLSNDQDCNPVAITKADHVAGELGYCKFLRALPYGTNLYATQQQANWAETLGNAERYKYLRDHCERLWDLRYENVEIRIPGGGSQDCEDLDGLVDALMEQSPEALC